MSGKSYSPRPESASRNKLAILDSASQLLNEISVELTSILDLDKLLQKVAQMTLRFIDYDFFAILLIDEDSEHFIWKTSVGFSEESYRTFQRLSIHKGLVGRAVRTGRPVVVNNVEQDRDYIPVQTVSGRRPKAELVLPLIIKDRTIGVLVLGSALRGFFRQHHLGALTPLAAQIAVAIENASLYEEKSRDALAKRVISEIAKEMTSILELDELLNRIATLMRRVIEYEILGIFLYDAERQCLELKVAIGYAEETVSRFQSLPIGVGLLGHAVRERQTLVSTDLPNDGRAISVRASAGCWTQSEVAIPLISRHRLLGGLVVESCNPKYFKPERLEILEMLARQMAVSIDNAQLFQQVLAKEQKLETDFALARDLQRSMIPSTAPQLKGYEIATVYKPAESLGGDYYDFLWMDGDHIVLTIGDVSGKGVAAAITMAATRSALRFAARLNSSPSRTLYHVNRRLFRDVKKRTYVTLFYAVLEVKAGLCRWSNAGHFPPLLLRADGSSQELSAGGTPLGMFDRSRYAAGRTQLRPGDLILFYTDGVTEALNESGEEFGRDRLAAALRRKSHQTAREILRTLSGELNKFTRGMEQHDDMTAFILKVGEDL
ncbi:MAG: SpoIIE family protein phosphatase [Acidobacteriia bacterium]|nr:SpoIIE family protein phosphatase [Terriglobia bacterium]